MFTGKYTTRKIHTKPYTGLEWRISISSLVRISMISLMSSLSLKLFLNFFGVWSKDLRVFSKLFDNFGNLEKSLVIVGYFPKMFDNVRVTFGQVLQNFRKSSEKSSKTMSPVCLYNKKNSTTLARIYEFYVLVARTISALTREILLFPLEHKIHIFSPPCNILY